LIIQARTKSIQKPCDIAIRPQRCWNFIGRGTRVRNTTYVVFSKRVTDKDLQSHISLSISKNTRRPVTEWDVYGVSGLLREINCTYKPVHVDDINIYILAEERGYWQLGWVYTFILHAPLRCSNKISLWCIAIQCHIFSSESLISVNKVDKLFTCWMLLVKSKTMFDKIQNKYLDCQALEY
jgi:hypothetical protein